MFRGGFSIAYHVFECLPKSLYPKKAHLHFFERGDVKKTTLLLLRILVFFSSSFSMKIHHPQYHKVEMPPKSGPCSPPISSAHQFRSAATDLSWTVDGLEIPHHFNREFIRLVTGFFTSQVVSRISEPSMVGRHCT